MVSIIMGSQSDLPIMQQAADFLKSLEIPYELTVVSAHRTPERMFDFAKTAKNRGVKVIIAGAGGAAHLPGMVASCTTLPVIGVPILSSNSIDGWDSVLSILQMPSRNSCGYGCFERCYQCRDFGCKNSRKFRRRNFYKIRNLSIEFEGKSAFYHRRNQKNAPEFLRLEATRFRFFSLAVLLSQLAFLFFEKKQKELKQLLNQG